MSAGYAFTYESLLKLVRLQATEVMNNTMPSFRVVTLVGSTKFPDVWKEAQRELTMNGAIVHTVGLFGHQENIDMSGPLKRLIDRVYLQKIQQSTDILVLNKDGYIGLGAWDEIFYAIAHEKSIYFLEPLSDECLKRVMILMEQELDIARKYPNCPLTTCNDEE